MKLDAYRRIYKQDYTPENQEDIDTLSITINDSFENVYDALTNQVTFQDNINCTVVTFTATLDSNYKPITPLTIKLNNFQRNIIGFIVVNAVSTNGLVQPDSGVAISYSINNNVTSSSNTTNNGNNSANPLTVTINYIKGIPANVPFNITAIIV